MSKYYYDISDVMRHNARITVAMGVRRAGKTRSSKKRAVKKALTGKKFIWLRHLEKEVDMCTNEEFVTDIKSEFNPDIEFSFKIHNKIKCLYADDKLLGYFLSVKDYEKIKGVAFDDVYDIYLDECFKITSRRERNYSWVSALLSILDTVDNRRDIVKLIMLSNTVTLTNEFFSELGIKLPKSFTIWKHPTLSIVVESVISEDMIEERRNSVIGKILLQTQYGKHSIENETVHGSDSFIIKNKPNGLKPIFTVRYYDDFINFYRLNDILYADLDKHSKHRIIMGLTDELADRYKLKKFRTYASCAYLKYVCKAIDETQILYTSPEVKELILSNI